ncbi:MAG: 3-hydroxyacyl-ACP dehydratase [Chitinophagaceae bacterium]|nr:MAG: 3-hydroxyacyl-ACP dehydratase [Chitinophagaceae bacterium]
MLTDNFYSLRSYEPGDLSLKAMIEFDPAHPIFKGHFPTVPVVPGVCMMQIIKEFFEKHSGRTVRLTKVPLMKFLSLINPMETPMVLVALNYTKADDTSFQVTASLFNENVVYFKFKGVATCQNI